MKKFISLLLVCLMLFSLGACGNNDSDKTQTTAPETTEAETTAEAIEPLTASPAAVIYNEAYILAEEWFGFYNKHYNYDDSFWGENNYEYIAVNHETVKSTSDLKAHLSGSFSEKLLEALISEAYLDKDGKLYHRCFAAGDRLPLNILDSTTAVLISEEEGKATFDVTYTQYYEEVFEEGMEHYRDATVKIEYVYENGNWVIDNHFTINLYAPYQWKGV